MTFTDEIYVIDAFVFTVKKIRLIVQFISNYLKNICIHYFEFNGIQGEEFETQNSRRLSEQ